MLEAQYHYWIKVGIIILDAILVFGGVMQAEYFLSIVLAINLLGVWLG